MQYALVGGKRSKALKGMKGICEHFKSEVVAKCGDIQLHHWAHQNTKGCDYWWEPETTWYREWKNLFSEEFREVLFIDKNIGEPHRADIHTDSDRAIFNDYVKNYIDRPPENVQLDSVTWERYKAFLAHRNNFQAKIRFVEIDDTLIARFKNYLSNLKGRKGKLDPATVKSYFDKLKVILMHAAKKDRLLDITELESHLEDVKISVIGERDKNGNPTIIPLFKFPYANKIIEKYRDPDPAKEFLFRRKVFIEVQAYNRNLKILATRAHVSRAISNKTGRHTNAQMWIRFGAERPVLSKMMGHEKEQTTENYYKVNLREVIEGTKGVDFQKFEI